MDERMRRMAAFLRCWRKKRGVKLHTASSALGVSVATWNHWETGRRTPSLDNYLALADYLEIPPQCMFCGRNLQCLVPRVSDRFVMRAGLCASAS